jgi:hypothetical protein
MANSLHLCRQARAGHPEREDGETDWDSGEDHPGSPTSCTEYHSEDTVKGGGDCAQAQLVPIPAAPKTFAPTLCPASTPQQNLIYESPGVLPSQSENDTARLNYKISSASKLNLGEEGTPSPCGFHPSEPCPSLAQALADDGTKFVSVVLSGRAADVFKTAEMINGIVNVCLAVSSFPFTGSLL